MTATVIVRRAHGRVAFGDGSTVRTVYAFEGAHRLPIVEYVDGATAEDIRAEVERHEGVAA